MKWLNNMIPFIKQEESLHSQSGVDVEGKGFFTYGYGHKDATGNLGNQISNLSHQEYIAWSDSTLQSDLHSAYKSGRQSFSNWTSISGATLDGGNYTTDFSTYDALPADAKAIITDFQYNLGSIRGYPKLMQALKDGDWVTVAAEHKRYLGGKELGRNKALFEKFIKPNLPVTPAVGGIKQIKSENKVFNLMLEKPLF